VLSTILGGIGLFLIGMVLMTDGLKNAAGDALKRGLARFTGGPLSAVAAGAGVTALVQSSSATTLTTIGFVSAGLLTFPQALGVILGANIGTTSTGWLVSMFGLKMSILPLAMPMVGAGALMRMLARGKVAALGLALAGFGLIFVGIATLQAGMADVAQYVRPTAFPPASLGGRALLLLLGIAMTVVMQSSSAAVATTLAAVSTGTVDIGQAAALVVGQNVGTTVTAGLAAVGASVAARRTALAHVLFNVFSGGLGFLLVPLFAWVVARAQGDPVGVDAAVALAVFHTTMNVAGVALVFPFTRRFAALVEGLVVDRGPRFTQHLDTSVTRIASVAVEAARRTLQEVLAWVATTVGGTARIGSPESAAAAAAALGEVRRFLAEVRVEHESAEAHRRHVGALHAVDHLEQLVELSAATRLQRLAVDAAALQEHRGLVAEVAALALGWCERPAPDIGPRTGQLSAALQRGVQRARPQVLAEAADGAIGTDDALDRLDAMRWLEGVAYHLHRTLAHLGDEDANAGGEAAESTGGPSPRPHAAA
jgi:phosphate:Na+ symporter